MTPRLSPWQLGATLYMPAVRDDIADVILHNKIPGLRSLVICLEDAIGEDDLPQALHNLQQVLNSLNAARQSAGSAHWPLVFIRPRHSEMGAWLVENCDLAAIDGLVLPKFTRDSLPVWWQILEHSHLSLMPTLETEEVFDVLQMRELAETLQQHPVRSRILALRIGGNDLMNILALRRSRHYTLYDSPMGYTIQMLIAVFGSRDFALTAPVCEHIDDRQIMDSELALDIAHGLVGKTAIHPSQIAIIEQALMVSASDHEDALRILNSSQAVFKSQGAMCEPATHRRWAAAILARAQVYGIAPEAGQPLRRFSAGYLPEI